MHVIWGEKEYAARVVNFMLDFGLCDDFSALEVAITGVTRNLASKR